MKDNESNKNVGIGQGAKKSPPKVINENIPSKQGAKKPPPKIEGIKTPPTQ